MMKFAASVSLAALALAGCGARESSSGTPQIGVVLKALDSEFWLAVKRGADQAATHPELDETDTIAESLLSVTVCDPACGSGHFLVAAGQRIAKRVAAVRELEAAVRTSRTAERSVQGEAVGRLAGLRLAQGRLEEAAELVIGFEEGVSALKRGAYTDVVVGYLFAESRMFEFVREVRAIQPAARVLCVKAGGRSLGADVRSGLNEAARQLGCEGFFDLTAGELPEGFNRAFEQLLAYLLPPHARSDKVEGVVSDLRAKVMELRSLA